MVDEIRLVGLVISDDLTWTKNTDSITKRAYAKLWMLRRLKALDASKRNLLDVYYKHIRSILEFGAPAWDGALTIKDAMRIEKVQRTALRIIFACKWDSYTKFLKGNNIEKLKMRRKKLVLNFAKKALKHEKFKSWFKPTDNINIFNRTKYVPTISRTENLRESPIPNLTRILNQNNGYK